MFVRGSAFLSTKVAMTVPSSRSSLRIALVGAGKMAQHHARAIARTGMGEVVAVADPNQAARKLLIELAPGARGFDSLEALLQQTRVDVVHIVTPPTTHESLTRMALEAGSHVYVEKPFVDTARAAAELLALADTRGLRICPGHQLLYEPPARRAAELLPALGDLAHVESYFSFRPIRRTPDGQTPPRADLQLLGILPHPIYVLLQFLEAAARGTTELTALEIGKSGTVHALVRRGDLTGTLIVTLEGRPVESYLRLVGSNGSIHADFVRSTVQRHIGPGTSGIDKLLAPYRHSRQLLFDTTGSMGRRFLKRQRSYPGLVELFSAFYQSVRDGTPPPFSSAAILETVRIWEQVKTAFDASDVPSAARTDTSERGHRVVVTGGTGLLGKDTVQVLVKRGNVVRVLARRTPPAWDRIPGAEYLVADLGQPLPDGVLDSFDTVIHAAAETAGGWEQHQRNSLDATEHMMRAAAAAGVQQFIHVSSLAVLASPRGGKPVADNAPLEPDSRGLGPYVWGKLESEQMAVRLGAELGVATKVVRPGALVDYGNFDPPGRLGKRLGNLFVAVGSPSHTLGVVEVGFSARTLAWMTENFALAPETLNLLSPTLPTKRQLIARLRQTNPDLRVIWLPTVVLIPLSWGATLLQKILRPGKPAINVAKVFAKQRYRTTRIAELAPAIEAPEKIQTPVSALGPPVSR
jgi:predicted dehydrogenase/nucleoside-diphosphate-sugar epimerase